jgi:membrane protein implicated in regulation of membrane protease activity
MIARFVAELGAWNWMVLGFALLAAEIVVPGVFLVWFGLAAIVTGLLSLALWDWWLWGWQAQTVSFLLLSLIIAVAGQRFVRARERPTDQPLLNQRAEQMVGRTATLEEAITEGRGRVRIGDTQWRVNGPDLPPGARVRIVGVRDNDLIVEPA